VIFHPGITRGETGFSGLGKRPDDFLQRGEEFTLERIVVFDHVVSNAFKGCAACFAE
jgi:hypothetical protein